MGLFTPSPSENVSYKIYDVCESGPIKLPEAHLTGVTTPGLFKVGQFMSVHDQMVSNGYWAHYNIIDKQSNRME